MSTEEPADLPAIKYRIRRAGAQADCTRLFFVTRRISLSAVTVITYVRYAADDNHSKRLDSVYPDNDGHR